MFNLEHSFCMPEVKILLNKVTNRGYLKNLDYEIALTISEAVSGEKGVRVLVTRQLESHDLN